MTKKNTSIKATHPGELTREIILPDLEMSIGKFFGNGALFWLNMQRNYDLAIAEINVDVSEIETVTAAE